VFYPYSPAVSGSLQKTLTAGTAATRRSGLALKVALIAAALARVTVRRRQSMHERASA